MKAICVKCHNYREVFFTVSINGAKFNFCKRCSNWQGWQFTVFVAVSQAFSKGSKIQ